MNIIVLDAISKSITARIEGAHTTTAPSFVSAYADATASAFTEGANNGVLNGANEVTIVAAPAASTRRMIREMTIYNADTVAHTLTISLLVTATYTIIRKVAIGIGGTYVFSNDASSNDASSFDMAATINTATAKTTPVDADKFGLWDSVSELLNHVTWANIKAALDARYTPTLGWTPVLDTWTYASASTITIPSDGTTTYQKGMRIRFKQGGGYKYAVAYAVTATLITIFVNMDYTIANAAITDISYSFVENPLGWPNWFSRTATGIISGSTGSAGTYAQTNASAVYKITGDTIAEAIYMDITNKGSWSGSFILISTVPASAAQTTALLYGGVWAIASAPSANRGIPYATANSNAINFVSSMGASILQWSTVAVGDVVVFSAGYRY